MSFTAAKFTELPLRTTFPLTYATHSVFSSSAGKPSVRTFRKTFTSSSSSSSSPSSSSSLRTSKRTVNAPWLSKWTPRTDDDDNTGRPPAPPPDKQQRTTPHLDKSQNAIERIVLRLRNLGIGSDGENEESEEGIDGGDFSLNPVTGEEKLGDLLKREWLRPDKFEDESEVEEDSALPWEREVRGEDGKMKEGGEGEKKRRLRAPTLAELTIEDEELRRLRRMGMVLRERVNVPKAGLTKDVLDKIHERWRKEELVRLKFHEVLAADMKTAHEIVERRTGGLVIWRAGSVMVVFRGSNYAGPLSKSRSVGREDNGVFVPDVSSVAEKRMAESDGITTSLTQEKSDESLRRVVDPKENMTEEETEFNSLLDDLGPRFEEWWGTGVLPVDADLLAQKVPDYKTPLRLLPTGMRSHLTNAEMTNLRKVAKSLPCHFALGRNRNHQGLAAAILKLWEKSLIVKIAVKRGIQNTNNKIMAEEIKTLTGGTILLRNKYYIVIFRGKDFLPTSVAAALAERNELTKEIQDVEEKVRGREIQGVPLGGDDGRALAGTLAEFYEAQAQWGRDISTEEREKMIEEDAKAKNARLVKRIEHKLAVAQAKKLRAERLLSKIEASMVPAGPDYDQETISEEERAMFRRVGLRMKAYLPLGIRGVFDGVIENMHLHWKHRELVKLISKQKTLAFVEDTAKLLEYESGGILVAIERAPKGFAIIYYRGKNYRRPIALRPRNLLTKAKALKRSVAMQRHEALSQHISELEGNIERMKKEIGVSSEEGSQLNPVSEFTLSEDEAFSGSHMEDVDDDEDSDSEADDDFEYSSFENHDERFTKTS